MGGLLHLVQQEGAWAGCSPADSKGLNDEVSDAGLYCNYTCIGLHVGECTCRVQIVRDRWS